MTGTSIIRAVDDDFERPPRAKKKFGQHFLTDAGLLDRFVTPLRELGAPAGARVVEIGPGRGDLTAALRRAGYAVTALELDAELLPHLATRFASDEGVEIRRVDALSVDYSEFPAPLWLAGNLPYQIATPLLVRILRAAPQLRGAVFLLQKEMATRLLAPPSTKDYAAVTALLQSFWKLSREFHVGRGKFSPPPRVDSTLIRVAARADAPVPRARFAAFEGLLRRAFAERRKTLHNNFRGRPEVLAALAAAGIDAGRRAETLSVAEFAAILSRLPA